MKVGGRKVLLQTTLLVPNDEVAEFVVPVAENDSMNVVLEFIVQDKELNDGKEERPPVKIELEGDNALFHLKFYNFDKPMGHSMGDPFLMGTSDNEEPITMLASIYKYKKMSKIEIQFMLEADI